MKKLILIAATAISAISYAAPVKTAVNNNGLWTSNGTWDLGNCPINGDTIVIPAGQTVIINSVLSYGSLYIKIYGILKFTGGKIRIDNTGSYMVFAGGKIKGDGSPSEQIRIGNDKIWDGNDGDIIGPQKADGTTNGFIPFNILPVKFIGFTATRQDKNVLVQWSTAEELNVNMFAVERSTDGHTWSVIAYLASAGNSRTVNNYSFTDRNFTATTGYYRIREEDIDGRSVYTSICTVHTEANLTAGINIASIQNKVLLQFPQQVKGAVLVQFIGMSGQLVGQQTISNPLGQVIVDPRLKGNYVVVLSKGNELKVAKQIIL